MLDEQAQTQACNGPLPISSNIYEKNVFPFFFHFLETMVLSHGLLSDATFGLKEWNEEWNDSFHFSWNKLFHMFSLS